MDKGRDGAARQRFRASGTPKPASCALPCWASTKQASKPFACARRSRARSTTRANARPRAGVRILAREQSTRIFGNRDRDNKAEQEQRCDPCRPANCARTSETKRNQAETDIGDQADDLRAKPWRRKRGNTHGPRKRNCRDQKHGIDQLRSRVRDPGRHPSRVHEHAESARKKPYARERNRTDMDRLQDRVEHRSVQIHVCPSKAVPELADCLVGCLLIRQRNRVGTEQGKGGRLGLRLLFGRFQLARSPDLRAAAATPEAQETRARPLARLASRSATGQQRPGNVRICTAATSATGIRGGAPTRRLFRSSCRT